MQVAQNEVLWEDLVVSRTGGGSPNDDNDNDSLITLPLQQSCFHKRTLYHAQKYFYFICLEKARLWVNVEAGVGSMRPASLFSAPAT